MCWYSIKRKKCAQAPDIPILGVLLAHFVMTHPNVKVVSALLEAPSSISSPSPVDTELRDSYGMTALFHTCNHGHHRYWNNIFKSLALFYY